MLVAASLDRALVNPNDFKDHQNQKWSNDEFNGLVNILENILVVNDLHGVNNVGGATGHLGRFAAHLGVLRPYSWTLMHYGQYKQVALTTPSNACYARSPKPIWANKRNRGHGKRRHNNRQFKIHAHIEWLVT